MAWRNAEASLVMLALSVAAPACGRGAKGADVAPQVPMVSAAEASRRADAGPMVPAASPLPLGMSRRAIADEEDLWVPGDLWEGHYVCQQGPARLWLTIGPVRGTSVSGSIVFEHVATRTRGAYEVGGTYDPARRRLLLEAGDWNQQPTGYAAVGFDGRLDPTGREYSGKIDDPGCGPFQVIRQRR